jgi:4-hydroxy-tetrahydrodipicolinate synthase
MQLRGCGTALVTPFHQDGSIDEAALRNLIAWQVESGVDFLIPCGTTGETPTLSRDEWLRVIDTTVEVVAGRVPIVAGATSNSTQDAVEKAREVASRPGVNAILTASPYYNKPTQEGQYRHFKAIAEAVDKSIILYNVPGRTSANIEPGTLARLSEVPNILGVKEASGNITQIAEVLNAVPETFLVFSGDDAITLPVVALGGVGIISVASNEIPAEMAALTRAALNNDWTTARSIHRKYLPLMQANFIESNPLPVKAVLAIGLTAILPVIVVVPVVEIPDLARIVKWEALPRCTGACGDRTIEFAIILAPAESRSDGLNAVMGRALPRAERLARAPTTNNSLMVFTIDDPLISSAQAQRNTALPSGQAVGFDVHEPVGPTCSCLVR